jgi:acyl dehydratase
MTEGSDDWRWGKITDQGLEKMRADIGVAREIVPWVSLASQDAIWHVAFALGDDNPLWWDREYAESSAAGAMFAPPAFFYPAHLELRLDPEVVNGADGWLPGTFALYAGDSWEWRRPILVDERLRVSRELESADEREGKFAGRTIAQVERIHFKDAAGKLIATLRKTTYRFERESGRERAADRLVAPPNYSEDDRRCFAEHYAAEVGQRRGAEPRYWEEVEVGDQLGTLLKGPLTLTNMIGWMSGWGATGCLTNRMFSRWTAVRPGARVHNPQTGVDDAIAATHWDEYFATESGMARGYDMGTQRIAWLTHCVTDWCGDAGQLLALDVRLRAPNYLGDVTWITGKVTAKSDQTGVIACELTGTNQRDEVTIVGRASVSLPTRRADISRVGAGAAFGTE